MLGVFTVVEVRTVFRVVLVPPVLLVLSVVRLELVHQVSSVVLVAAVVLVLYAARKSALSVFSACRAV